MFSAANPVRVPLKNSEGHFELEQPIRARLQCYPQFQIILHTYYSSFNNVALCHVYEVNMPFFSIKKVTIDAYIFTSEEHRNKAFRNLDSSSQAFCPYLIKLSSFFCDGELYWKDETVLKRRIMCLLVKKKKRFQTQFFPCYKASKGIWKPYSKRTFMKIRKQMININNSNNNNNLRIKTITNK